MTHRMQNSGPAHFDHFIPRALRTPFMETPPSAPGFAYYAEMLKKTKSADPAKETWEALSTEVRNLPVSGRQSARSERMCAG